METKAEIRAALVEKIEADLARETRTYRAHECIAAILRDKYDGKKVTKRIEKQFRDAFYSGDEKPVVLWTTEYGLGQVVYWEKNYNDRESHMVGYVDTLVESGKHLSQYNPAVFEDTDICHGSAAKERNEARQRLLANPAAIDSVVDRILAYREARATLDSFEFGTDEQEIEYLAKDLAGFKSSR